MKRHFAIIGISIEVRHEQGESLTNYTRKASRTECRRSLPAAFRKEIAQAARQLNRRYRQLLKADPKLKDRVSRFFRSLLLPKPKRRGRPGIPSVTRAIALLKRYRREHPSERAELLWRRIYPEVIPGYASITEVEQADARQILRERVRWRMKGRLKKAHDATT